MPEPFTPGKPFEVHYTDRPGGDWKLDADFSELDTAKRHAAHLLGQGKASVRVVKVEHYESR